MTLPTTGIDSEDDFSPISVGDRRVSFKPKFWQWDGDLDTNVPVDLSNLTIGMKMANGTTVKTCSGTWTKTDASNGKASYAWQTDDVDTAGTWTLYITLTDGDGLVAHADTKTLEIKSAP